MRRIIIDTDPGIDDAIALLLLCAADSVRIDGVTTVGGNVDLDLVTANTLTVLELAGRTDVPVYPGAGRSSTDGREPSADVHGVDGLGGLGRTAAAMRARDTPAVDFLTAHAAAHPGEVTLLPIGPLTNIAAAVEADPAFVENVASVVLMGGAEGAGNMTPSAEFNLWYDPRAADVVFSAGFADLIMVGLDATRQADLAPGVGELLRLLDTPVSRFIHAITRSYVDVAFAAHGRLACDLHDPLAAAFLLDPAVIATVPADVSITVDGEHEGRSVVTRTAGVPGATANARVATGADTARFYRVLLTTLFPESVDVIERVVAHEYR
ncbi:nucleoside hydrolase [Occultella glacieicola]|nr:nucleoside hydrolase [Occultella glacieicola]